MSNPPKREMTEHERETLNAICRSGAACHSDDEEIIDSCRSLAELGYLRPVPMLSGKGVTANKSGTLIVGRRIIKVAYEAMAAGIKADRAAQAAIRSKGKP